MSSGPLLSTHLIISLIAVLFVSQLGTAHQAFSVAAGAAVMSLNWLLLGWSWARILQKKSIALAVSVIVFKYALLGACLVVTARQNWTDGLFLGLGVATVLPTVAVAGMLKSKRQNAASK